MLEGSPFGISYIYPYILIHLSLGPCLFMYFMWVHCLAHQKRASDPITDVGEPPRGCWDLNSGLSEEQSVLLTPEPFLWPPKMPVLSVVWDLWNTVHKMSNAVNGTVLFCMLLPRNVLHTYHIQGSMWCTRQCQCDEHCRLGRTWCVLRKHRIYAYICVLACICE